MNHTQQPTRVSMDIDDFIEKFKPVKNHLNKNASWDGCMFETYGDELRYVTDMVKTNPGKVWTITDAEGYQVVSDGMRYVNRTGYLITQEAADPNSYYDVTDPDDNLDEDED